MEFRREDPDCRFTVPDRPTVRQQMTFQDAISRKDGYLRSEFYWRGAISLIDEWECESFPDPRVSLDEVDNRSILSIINWASTQVLLHVTGLEDISKN